MLANYYDKKHFQKITVVREFFLILRLSDKVDWVFNVNLSLSRLSLMLAPNVWQYG